MTDQYRTVLSDFGVSRALDEIPSGLSTSNCLGGTLRYCCPELVNDSETKKSLPNDIWAWGCTVLEILTGMIPYADLKSEPTLILALMQGRFPADKELLVIPVPELRTLLTRCWNNEPDQRPSVGDCFNVVKTVALSQPHTETTVMTAQQSPSKSPEVICVSLDAENIFYDPAFSSILEDISGVDHRPSPCTGQKRSSDAVADPPKHRKRVRLTFQDELDKKRAAEFVAARRLGIKDSLDFLDEAICNYQAVAAKSSQPNVNETANSRAIKLPTIESLVQIVDQAELASRYFPPSDLPEKVPDLEPSSAASQDGPTSPLSPQEEVDTWRWALGSTPSGLGTPPLGNSSELLPLLPAREAIQSLFQLDVYGSLSDRQRNIPNEETVVGVVPDRQPLPETGSWRWEGEMETDGEWPINFPLT